MPVTTSKLSQNLQKIVSLGIDILFNQLNRGIEKESLRMQPNGKLALTPHPKALGSPLTHPQITTDYCEAQLEFVSPVFQSIENLTSFLTSVHHYTYQNIGDEKLWVNSMPCILGRDEDIPIARFGSSNIARMKEIYREGLGNRYGRLMQTISGIHYNFSLPDEFWPYYLGTDNKDELKDQISEQYFGLIRNFHRNVWLIFYLFGASPAVCKTFLTGREHHLDNFEDNSFFAPYATSLRMSDIGYSNQAQKKIHVCYNTLENYTETLKEALKASHAPYEEIGVKVEGEYKQLNANLLQIENEFYAAIRPKRVTEREEKPIDALNDRGVEYVEVRCIDLNPFVPIGIGQETIRFLDMFLLFCLFSESPEIEIKEHTNIQDNKNKAVLEGRDPDLMLIKDGQEIKLRDWAKDVCEQMIPIADLLDSIKFTNHYRVVLDQQIEKIEDDLKTPSGRVMKEMSENFGSFFEFSLSQSIRHEKFFKHIRLNEASRSNFADLAEQSIKDQQDIEAADSVDFDAFMKAYFGE